MTDGNSEWSGEQRPGSMPPPGYPQPGYPQPGYQQVPPGYSAYGQPASGPVAQSNGKATTSMVLGIVGLVSMFLCGPVVSIVMGPIAYFMGRSAQKEIELAPQSWSNAGMAKAGWIIGLIQTILSIVLLIAVIGFFIWVISVDDSNF